MTMIGDAKAACSTPHSDKSFERLLNTARFFRAQWLTGFHVGDVPEFDDAGKRLFFAHLQAAGSYLEFGSGGSSIAAARAGTPMISVESDRVYLDSVRAKLRACGCHAPRRQTLIHADIGFTGPWGAPVWHKRTSARLARWRRYPFAPWNKFAALPAPHLILIDGRFRVACALLAIKFLSRRNGIILFDDYEDRDHYHVIERHAHIRLGESRMSTVTARPALDTKTLDADIEWACGDWR
jgi:hypothetical protein